MATSGVRGTNRWCEGTSAQFDREIGTLRPMETKSRATLIESLDLPRVALGPWGSLVYPWWFGTTRLRFKSGRTHSDGKLGGGSQPVTLSRGTKTICSFEIARDPWVLRSRWGRECRDPLEGNRKVGDPILQLVLEFVEGLLHRPTADHAPRPNRFQIMIQRRTGEVGPREAFDHPLFPRRQFFRHRFCRDRVRRWFQRRIVI